MADLKEIPNRDAVVDTADRVVSRPWNKWLTDLRLAVNRLIAGIFDGDVTATSVTTTGAITAGTQFLAPDGTLANVSYAFTGDPNTGIGHTGGADVLQLITAGVVRLTVTTGGIGLTLPVVATPDNTIQLGLSVFAFSKTFGGAYVGRTITPASLGANQNNYAPTGLSTAYVLALTASTPVNITGLVAAGFEEGRPLLIANYGVNAITLVHESGSSTDTNRLFFHDATNRVLATGGVIAMVRLPVTNNRWVNVRS